MDKEKIKKVIGDVVNAAFDEVKKQVNKDKLNYLNIIYDKFNNLNFTTDIINLFKDQAIFTNKDNLLISEAAAFAKKAHENVKRKYTEHPYYTHVCRVAGLVAAQPQANAELIAAAYLHDVRRY